LNKHKNLTWYQSSVHEEAIAQASLAPFHDSRHLLAATAIALVTATRPPPFPVKLVLALSLGRWA
jgi:hypothetical protein